MRPGTVGVVGGGSHGSYCILFRAVSVSIRIEDWSLFSWSWGNFISGVSIRFWKMETRGWMLEEDTDQVGPIKATVGERWLFGTVWVVRRRRCELPVMSVLMAR